MKRESGLYSQIYDMNNIRLAFDNARKKKSHYTEVKIIRQNPDPYLQKIHDVLKNKNFRTSKYEIFNKIDHHKEREIFKLPFYPDRIVHHCILQILAPIWKKIFIRDTYASIKKRGIHDGAERVKKALVDDANTQYCLKLDIRKFYPSIRHNILKALIEYKIKDRDVLWLLFELIDSTDNIPGIKDGVPIGSVPSQYFGNIDLAYFDHWIKEVKKIHYYYRYCDDMVILHKSHTFLHNLLKEIGQYLTDELKHDLNKNYQIFPVDARGIDFLGYRFFHRYILVRKSIVDRFKTKVKEINESGKLTKSDISSLASYKGWFIHANTHNLITKYLLPIYSKYGIKHKALHRFQSRAA